MVRPTTYIREVIQELQRVSWPTRQQTIDKTLLVLGVCLIVGVYVGAIDFTLQWVMSMLIR